MRIYQLVEFNEDDCHEDAWYWASQPSKLFLEFDDAYAYAKSNYDGVVKRLKEDNEPGLEFMKFKMTWTGEIHWTFKNNQTGRCYLIYPSHTKEFPHDNL